MANFFSIEHSAGMPELARLFLQIKIPVYVIACGAQADTYADLEKLVGQIGEPSKQFISAIYQTGGEFALRGYFTKAFFDKLGFPSAVVTGCPSMYQLGRAFWVSNKKTDELKPVVNGKVVYVRNLLKQYPQSVLMDQDLYFRQLYDPEYFCGNASLKKDVLFHYYLDRYSAALLAQKRIKMIADMCNWYTYLQTEGFNYSIGSRIHGNIMSIISGIPATVLAHDTRTREMAEFFNIPLYVIKEKETLSISKIRQLYYDADYTKFNLTYKEKYQKYEEFLKKNGIVSRINEKNMFFANADERRDFDVHVINATEFVSVSNRMRNRAPLLELSKIALKIKNRRLE